MPSEKPVGRPLADSREPRQLGLDLVVGEGRERMQVEVGARAPERIAPCRARSRGGRSSGEAPATASRASETRRVPFPNAEALDEAVLDRAGRLQRDLLRRDRADEHLERLGRERGRKPRSRASGAMTGSGSNPARSNSAPRSFSTTRPVSSSSGSTSTPPGAASIRTSCPPTTRAGRLVHRFARSGRTPESARSSARSRTAAARPETPQPEP